jgi:cytochrome c oxidase cbb3-type subunit III
MSYESQNEEEQQDRVIHEVDGIEEYDNKLPNWWLYSLYGTIFFAAVYWFVFQTARYADSPEEAYKALLAQEASKIKIGEATPEALSALTKDASALALGKQVFASTCAPCHRTDGGGNVGPNLTDDFWIHGNAPENVYKTIANGVPDKGMPAWQKQLGPLKTQAVTAYVLGLRGTNVPGGKPPQGERASLSRR